MTSIVHIEHAVGGFDAWMGAFKSDPVGRQKLGVRKYRILRPNDDPNFVMLDLEFATTKEAEIFGTSMRNLWNSPEAQRFMKNPQLRIVELVETKEY